MVHLRMNVSRIQFALFFLQSYQSKIYRARMSPSTVKAVSKAFSTVLSFFIHVIYDRTGGVTICCRTHQYNPSFGCGKLHQDPFVTVWTPQAEPVSFRQPDCQQTSCNNIHLQTGRAGIALCLIDVVSDWNDTRMSRCLIIKLRTVFSFINHPVFFNIPAKVQTLACR